MAKDGIAETERSREMRRLLVRHERIGLTLSEFARRDLVLATLYWWRRRLRDAGSEMSPSVSFTEVSAVGAAAARRGFELVLDGGTVRVPERSDPASLRTLLATLREC